MARERDPAQRPPVHPVRYSPKGPLEVHVLPTCATDFTRSRGSENQKFQRELGGSPCLGGSNGGKNFRHLLVRSYDRDILRYADDRERASHCLPSRIVGAKARRYRHDITLMIWLRNFRAVAGFVSQIGSNTFRISRALNEAFPPAEAKALWDRFEFVYTPKHGSWLNVAEVELNVMIRQCLNRRIASLEVLRDEVAAWQASRDRIQSKVNWQFTTDDARVKLKRLYPTLDE